MESVVDAAVETELVDPVRSNDAASRGRLLAGCEPVEPGETLGAVMLILAASWFNEGIRPAPGLSGFGALITGGAACADAGGVVDISASLIVMMEVERQQLRGTERHRK